MEVLFGYILIITVTIGGHCWVCPTNTRIFTEVGQRPVLPFNTNGRHTQGDVTDINTFNIVTYIGTNIFTVNYENGVVLGNPYTSGCSLGPNADLANGALHIELDTVQTSGWGTFTLTLSKSGLTAVQCITLYVIGPPSKPEISQSGTLYEGTSLRLTCSSTSTTQPSNHSLSMTYNWTRNGSKVTADNRFSFDSNLSTILTISNLSRTKDNNLVMGCTSTENKGKSSQATYYTINVQYGPENIRFNPSGDFKNYYDGDTFTPVTCLAECQPDCNISWGKEGTTQGSTAVLDLDVLNSEKLGTYICTATHTVMVHTLTKTLNVSVVYGPSTVTLIPHTLSYTKNEGESLTPIMCSADCFPACHLRWLKSSGASATLNENPSLSLGEVHRTERGTYKCKATNPKTLANTSSQEVTVNVRYGPDTVTLSVPNVHTVTEGSTIKSINCSTECWPSCAFIWTNLTDNLTINTSQVLAFGTVDRYDAGNYKCLARNSATQYTREAANNFSLRVQYAPDVLITKSTTLWTENSPLGLKCTASGVPALYNYTGFVQRVGETLVPNSHVEIPEKRDSISVNIPSLHLQDTGMYTCYVHNGIIGVNKELIQTASLRINVQASPVVILTETNFPGETSGNITIHIPFVSFPHYTTYNVLKHDGKTVSMDGKYILRIRNDSVNTTFYGQAVTLAGHVFEMTITDLLEEDFGVYSIQITNDVNTTNFSLNVTATSKPSTPTELNLTAKDNVITFEWKKGFNGGHEQTFVLQTSFNSDDSWMNITAVKEFESKYINENGTFQVTLTNLDPGVYLARLLAFNLIGATEPLSFKGRFEVKELAKEKSSPASGALIGGAAGGSLGVAGIAVVIVVVVIFKKKRKTQKDHDDSCRLTSGQKLAKMSHRTGREGDSIPDEVVNPMYVSGDDVDIVTSADIYATPDKKKPKQNTGAGDIYAVVDKKRINKDAYENSDNIQMKKGKRSTHDNSKEKQVNKDGLVYADIVFANQPKGQKKLVIHGIDEKTEYAQVDLTKRADPLPDSDEDQTEK